MCVLAGGDLKGAVINAGPGDAGVRATVAAAQPGDTVVLTQRVELLSPLRIDKRLTLTVNVAEAYRIWIEGTFEGELLQIGTNGVVLEAVRLIGSPHTDGLRLETNVVLRDCTIQSCRRPVASDFWTTVRLERCLITANQQGFECWDLEAKDSTFSFNGGYSGVNARNADLDGCLVEHNQGDGLSLIYGRARNCTFRFNGVFGLRFDPDPGLLALSGCLFYANAGGGLLLREEAIATVDNCTFTRHTGPPAIIVTEAHEALFRHCTVVDNVVTDPGGSPWYPSEGAFALGFNGRVELQNCLVAENPTSEDPDAIGIGENWMDGGGNVIGGAARLGVLNDNGGPTLSMLPRPGSPAIDAGVPSELVADARGFSRLAGDSPDAGATEADAGEVADTDHDGVPDIWEIFYGLNPTNAFDAALDKDGDGQSALAEFHHRTDPTDARSALRFEPVTLLRPPALQPNLRTIYLTWNIHPGVIYEVETSNDFRQWREVPEFFFLGDFRNGRRTLLLEVQGESGMSFYRLRPKGNVFD